MRSLVIFLVALILTSCALKDDGRQVVMDKTEKTKNPEPTLSEWGDLQCQKNRNCEDAVLNIDLRDLLLFLQIDFSKQLRPQVNQEEAIYRCGVIIGNAWTKQFGEDGMDPQLNNFLLQVMDPILCLVKPDFDQKINNYFIQTKEYKNEIQ